MTERRRSGPTLLLCLGSILAFAACSGAHEGKPLDLGPGFAPPKPAPLIRLARAEAGLCPARCPKYSVEVDVEGGVTYAGLVNVKTIGPATGHMSPEALQQLRDLMAKAHQTRFPTDRCACGCMEDVPTVDLTTWEKGAARTVRYHEGCDRAPHAIRVLETGVDDLVGIDQWIGTIQQRRLCFQEHRDCTGFGTPAPPKPDGGR